MSSCSYRLAGKFGESSVICQTKTIQITVVLTINSLLADLLIRQTSFHQMLEVSQFAKLSPQQTFLLRIWYAIDMFLTM